MSDNQTQGGNQSNSIYSSRNRSRPQEQQQKVVYTSQGGNKLPQPSGAHELPKPTNSSTLPLPSRSSQVDDTRESRDGKGHNHKDDRRDHRDSRDSRDTRNSPAQRENRGYRDPRDYRDSRDSRDSMGPRDYRDSRGDYRDTRGPRDGRGGDYRDRTRDHQRRGYGDRRDYGDRRSYGDGRYNDYDRRDNRDYRPKHDSRDSRGYTPRESRSYGSRDSRDFRESEEDLTNVVPIDRLSRESKWDIKPKGFENVSSEKAKISGFFPLPGEKRKVDISKLEGLVSNGDLASTSILFDTVDIEPYSSHMSKILRITDVEFTLFPIERLIESIKNFIENLKDEVGFIVKYDLKVLPVTNKQYLVVEFSNSSVATSVYCSFQYFQNTLNLRSMSIERPDSYISFEESEQNQARNQRPNRQERHTESGDGTPTAEDDDDDEEEEFPDSSKKLAILNVPKDTNVLEFRKLLSAQVDEVTKFKPLINKKNEIENVVFAEFKNLATGPAILKISELKFGEAQLNSIEASNSFKIQDTMISYRNLSDLSKIGDLRITKVLILLNLIKPEHLKSQGVVNELYEDVQFKLSQYGEIEKIHIPTPTTSEFKKSIKTVDSNIGKIYVKFKDLKSAKLARDELRGMKYNERTLLCAFQEELDFDLGIL